MKEGQIRLALDVPDGYCGICRTEPAEDEPCLQLQFTTAEGPATVTACRACLAEYHPDFLAFVEGADEPDAFSLGGPS